MLDETLCFFYLLLLLLKKKKSVNHFVMTFYKMFDLKINTFSVFNRHKFSRL